MKNNRNLFKNSGIRGIAPNSISLWNRFKELFKENKQTFFTIKNVNTLGFALSYYLHTKHNQSSNILIATDTRQSRHWIQHRLQTCFRQLGHNVFHADIAPTPFVAKALKDYKQNDRPFFQLGIVITASHNPGEYNGLKIMTPEGYLTEQDEQEISNIFYQFKTQFKLYVDYVNAHVSFVNFVQPFQITPLYEAHIKQQLPHLPTCKNLKIVLDCANGATYKVAPHIFQKFGIETIIINDSPDGENINQGSGCTNPDLLIQAVQEHEAHWGCAFDGDGDRVIIVDNKGKIFDGDDICIILSQHPNFQKESTIVGTIMSNQTTEEYFTTHKKSFLRTAVGERNLIETLQAHNAQIGSEPCGHITIMNHAYCSDGIFAALLFFDTLQQKNQWTVPTKLPQMHTTIQLAHKIIEQEAIDSVINAWHENVKPGRIIARKSNTEPILRIMIEHPDKQKTNQILKEVEQQFIEYIN